MNYYLKPVNLRNCYFISTCFTGTLLGMNYGLKNNIIFNTYDKIFPENQKNSEIKKAIILLPLYWGTIFGFGFVGCISGPISVPLSIGYALYKKNIN